MTMTLPLGTMKFLAWLQASNDADSPLRGLSGVVRLGLALTIDWRSLFTRLRDGTVRLVRELNLSLRRLREVLPGLAITWMHMTRIFTITRLLLRDMVQMPDFWATSSLWISRIHHTHAGFNQRYGAA